MKFLIIITFISVVYVKAQDTFRFYEMFPSPDEGYLQIEISATKQDIINNAFPNILRWQPFFFNNNEPIKLLLNADDLDLNSSTFVLEAWRRAIEHWNSIIDLPNNVLTEDFTGVRAYVETNYLLMPNYFYTPAKTGMAIWWMTHNEQDYYTYTYLTPWGLYPVIIVNNCPEFQGVWLNKEYPDKVNGEADIEGVFLHELGHVFGLAHKNAYAVMNEIGKERFLEEYERKALEALYLLDVNYFPETPQIVNNYWSNNHPKIIWNPVTNTEIAYIKYGRKITVHPLKDWPQQQIHILLITLKPNTQDLLIKDNGFIMLLVQ